MSTGTLFRQVMTLLAAPEPPPKPDLRVAVAVLLVEAAWRDDVFAPEERAVIARLLQKKFALSDAEAAQILTSAEAANRNIVQLHPYVRTILEHMPPEERIQLVEMMWEVVYADGVLDPEEDALIRRMVDLIHITDRDRVLARKRVLERLDREP